MRRVRPLYLTIFIVSIGAVAFVADFLMTTLEGDGHAQTVEVADLPAKVQDRAPGAESLEVRSVTQPPQAVRAPSAALPAIETANTEPQPSPNPGRSLWSYKGSVLQLERAGRSRRFSYADNREGSTVKSGELLFEGVREGPVISGQALAHSQNCPPMAYPVKGSVNAEETIIRLRGKQPRRDEQCNVVGYFDAELVFSAMQYRIIRAQNESRNSWQAMQIDADK